MSSASSGGDESPIHSPLQPHQKSQSQSPTLSSGPQESPCQSPATLEESTSAINEDQVCKICEERFKNPKVLSCLHVYCQACLEKLVAESSEEQTPPFVVIECPECKQETAVPMKGVGELLTDHVLCNQLDMSAIADMQIVCTSCKAKEKAVARCSDCANFLCPNCVTAHQYMRCFENHKVVSFEELTSSEGMAIHKPLFCTRHSSETMKYYCNTCQQPICNECIMADHKQPDHHYERIADVEGKQVEEVKNLISEGKGKVQFCEEAASGLGDSLAELQMQRDNMKGLIVETFQSYKAILEKRKEDLLQELEEIHSSHELSIMETSHNVEKITEKMEDACVFANRILEHGNILEVLLMKKLVSSQLLSLINNCPKPEVSYTLDFITDTDKFSEAIKLNFGTIDKGETKEVQASSLQSSFETEGYALPPGILSPENPGLPHPSSAPEFLPSITSMPPISMPSMSLGSSSSVSNHTITSIASALGNMAGVERSASRNSHSPAMSDSGISVDTSSGSGASTPMVNLGALGKLGNVSINSQGQITLNGQLIPGLNINSVSSLPPPPLPPQRNPPTPTEQTWSSGSSSRATTPHLDAIASLLNQAPPINPMGSNENLAAGLGSMSGMLSQPMGKPILSGSMMSPGASPHWSSNIGGEKNDSFSNMGNLQTVLQQAGMAPASMNGSGQQQGFVQGSHPPFPARTGKMSAMQIRCKFGQLGPGKGQFNSPHGFCLGVDEDIIVADTNNHRIQVFEKTGEFKYQFGIPGREEGQLWYPRKVAVMRHTGKYVVCDRGNERSRMQIFTKSGHFIKKIAIRYIDIVAGLVITQQGHIVAVDSVSPTVFCIAESGDLLKWFDCSDYMREPSDIAISGKEYFVCDFKGHCVVVFNEDGQFMRRIGCENITNFPNGIDISDAGDVLVGDSHGNRFHVAVFQRDGSLIGEFECPYVKVSRCCGLKITSEGYIVTLAKNNHHVLVLNTLYIT